MDTGARRGFEAMRPFVRGLQGRCAGVQGHGFITSAEPKMECRIAEASLAALLDDREPLNFDTTNR